MSPKFLGSEWDIRGEVQIDMGEFGEERSALSLVCSYMFTRIWGGSLVSGQSSRHGLLQGLQAGDAEHTLCSHDPPGQVPVF